MLIYLKMILLCMKIEIIKDHSKGQIEEVLKILYINQKKTSQSQSHRSMLPHESSSLPRSSSRGGGGGGGRGNRGGGDIYEHSYGSRFGSDDYGSDDQFSHGSFGGGGSGGGQHELYDDIPDNTSVRSGHRPSRGQRRGGGSQSNSQRRQYGQGGGQQVPIDPYDDYNQSNSYYDEDDVRSERSVNPFEESHSMHSGGGRSSHDRHSMTKSPHENRRSSSRPSSSHQGSSSGRGRSGSSRMSDREDNRSVRSHQSLNPFGDNDDDGDDHLYHPSSSSSRLPRVSGLMNGISGSGGYKDVELDGEGVSLLGGATSGDRILLSDGGQGRPCVYLVFALIFMITGIAGAQVFMSSDCVANAMDVTEWKTDAGYNLIQFIGLCLQTYALPFGFCLFFIFISQSANHPYWSHKRKSITYGLLSLCLLIFSILSAWIYADNLLGCLTTSLCVDNTVGKYESGYVITTGLIYASVCFPVALVLGLLAARNAKQIGVKEIPRMFSRTKQQADSYLSNPALPRNKKSTRWTMMKNICAVVTVLFIFLPFVIFLCMLLPDEFTEITHYAVQHYESEKFSSSQGPVLNFPLSEKLVLKLYPDIMIFYGALYLVAFLGMFARLCQPLADLLAAPPPALFRCYLPTEGVMSCILKLLVPTGYASSNGEVCLIFLLFALLAGEGYYWFFLHEFQCNIYFCHGSSASMEEQLARSLGQLGNVVMGLLVLPVSRHSVLAPLLGISWDKCIGAHTFLGYLFILIAIAHEFAWWLSYKKYGLFPKDILPFPSSYDPDNWAIGLQVGTVWIVFVVMGLLASWLVRRKAWELFHVTHHIFLALFIATLWHATSSWQYVLCGLSLWFLDRFLRLGQTSRRVHVQGLDVQLADESSGIDDGYGDDDAGAITVLSYTINAKGMYSMPGGLSDLKEGALNHEVGQFVLVNIPALSLWEWHPFSISSSPMDPVTTHHIKARGKNTWTGRLLSLAKQAQGGSVPFENLSVKIEGPYGIPPQYEEKAAVLLIAGGVGITPLHGLFRAMYTQAKSKSSHQVSTSFHFPDLIRLVWVAPDSVVFDMFLDTFLQVLHDDLDGRFSFKLHDSKAYRPGLTRGKDNSSLMGNNEDIDENGSGGYQRESHRDRHGRSKSKPYRLPYENGRPCLDTEMRRVEQFGSSALVYCVGPDSLKKQCAGLSAQAGVPFRTDNFEL
mmetsp:Transcript_19174/g.22856  ORF Transcript_19174/g.22856 Transcript_19174/m.22856 type:complete len:1186 (+) Transcript_19174:273-3830(+)